ncbi:MarR family winged helix-turn-helix transcriptional regulator [uncultured Tenacibaculum sp.]|uniref:MarR family winged helix-turn-helix transcriptional regulator n=1 Tax=uncultured Tenacibaculum sp. TaxID=174713 RepID=UPI0026394BD8|nr:MarR family winged helix-turn-helix transcriptional regulator [uncultured Tenacibaculum sp.]
MNESTFNPEQQEKDISSKIVAGLERVSEVFKKLLWEKAKLIGLSPIQIQILIFITFHKRDLCNVSHLAKEFNVTKPTISDAIRVLHKKELIIKDYSSSDNRSYTIILSEKGKEIVSETQGFSNPLKNQVDNFEQQEKESLFETLSTLIHKLNKNGILSVQRTCYGCKFYQKNDTSHFCNLLNTQLHTTEIRLDCSDFEIKN